MTGLLIRIYRAVFKKKETRQVLLIKYDKDVVIRTAHQSDCGWIAKCFESTEDSWCVLLPDGRTEGYSLVKNWLPHKGWKWEELIILRENLPKFTINNH